MSNGPILNRENSMKSEQDSSFLEGNLRSDMAPSISVLKEEPKK